MALDVDVPLELTTRGLTHTETNLAKRLVQRYAAKLGSFDVDITACEVMVERPQKYQDTGNPFRVRVHILAPGQVEIVSVKEPGQHEMHESMQTVVKSAFHAAIRSFRDELDRRRGRARRRDPSADLDEDAQPAVGFVVRVQHALDFGFLMSADGREVYFHRNAVLHGDFDSLHPGDKVRYETEQGEDGPQATTVQVLERHGRQADSGAVEDPRGWARQDD